MTQQNTPATSEGPGSPSGTLFKQIVLVMVLCAVLAAAIIGLKRHDAAAKQSEAEAANALNPNQMQITKAAEEAIELKTETVALERPMHVITANGAVHFSPNSTINISPRLTGRVLHVYVTVGDTVHAGQPLMQMSSSDAANAYDAARDTDQHLALMASALEIARKQFKLGTPEVTAAQASLDQAHENTLYNKRMLELTREQNSIGGFTDKPLTDAQSAVRQTETQLAQDQKDQILAQRQFERSSKLFAIGAAAKQDVETAEDALGKVTDAVANDREQLGIARITLEREQKAYNTRLYANQNVRQAETNYEQAVIQERAAGVALQMARVAMNKDLKQAEHDYNTALADSRAAHNVLTHYDNPTEKGLITINSPAEGVITARNVNPGQIVDQSGQTPWQMFTIINARRVYVDAQIFEANLTRVRVGQHLTAVSDSLPSGYKASGAISYVSPGLDPTSHALSVRADIDNSRGLLKEGMFLNVSIDGGSSALSEAVPVIPLTAVVHDGDSDYVYTASADRKYTRVKVALGEQRGEGKVLITKGLKPGDTIVTHGALYLGAGGTAAD